MNNLDLPNEFDEIPKNEQQKLLDLCYEYFNPINSINLKHTSYGLKHKIQFVPNGMYCTNGQFKGAMLKLGFYSNDINRKQNCHFNVSERSKAFKHQYH